MRKLAANFRTGSAWASASLVTLLPFVMAYDYGGMLPWTQWVSGIVILVAAVLALPTSQHGETQGGLRFCWPIGVLLVWALIAWIQVIPLPHEVVKILSPASAAAYSQWLGPIIENSGELARHPISVNPAESRHSIALMVLAAVVGWTASTVFQNRNRLAFMLGGLALGASAIGILGAVQLLVPQTDPPTDLFGNQTVLRELSFATFINRNNAAFLMNIGLASSLGLLVWRISALIREQDTSKRISWEDVEVLAGDRDSVIALVGMISCSVALLVGGSRGGLVAAACGAVFAFVWIRAKRGMPKVLNVVVILVGIVIGLLWIPSELNLKSIERLGELTQDTQTLRQDGRLLHWADGLRAAQGYLPMGSGLGTYADAHLPYLETSPTPWYEHADNLWLELLAEQGIVGVIVALMLIVGLVLSLRRLNESSDPIDHGLCVAGWYFLGTVLVSQALDFGLIIPANTYAVAILCAVILSRQFVSIHVTDSVPRKNPQGSRSPHGRATKPGSETPRSKIQFRSRQSSWTNLGVAMVVISTGGAACWYLTHWANVDGLVRHARFALKDESTTPVFLQQIVDRLDARNQQSPTPAAYRSLCNLNQRLARYDELIHAKPTSIENAKELFQETTPRSRRLPWRESLAKPNDTKLSTDGLLEKSIAKPKTNERALWLAERYQTAADQAEAELRIRPLGRAPRTDLLYLDFVSRDVGKSNRLFKQLRRLYCTHPPMLLRLSTLAVDSGEHEVGVEMMKEALVRDVSKTIDVLRLSEKVPGISPVDLIPRSPEHGRAAVEYLVRRPATPLGVLANLARLLRCEQCETSLERSQCEEIAGDVSRRLSQKQPAIDHYENAVRFAPSDPDLRVKFIESLAAAGQSSSAMVHARKAKARFKEDSRFDRLIEELAAKRKRSTP